MIYLIKRNFLFWLSRKINYPLVSPDTIQINFTFRCNLRCKMCSMHDRLKDLQSQNRPVELDVSVMRKVIQEAASMGVNSLILVGGEPFLEPQLFDLISFANHCGIDGITVVTNGTLLSRKTIERVFESNLSNLSISIDAAREETYRHIRGENVLQQIIDNIHSLNALKKEANRGCPSVVSVCTIMDQNLEELIDVVRLCRELGIGRIIFQPVVGDNTNQSKSDFSSPSFVRPDRYNVMEKAIDELIKYKISDKSNFEFIANSINHLRFMKKYFRGRLSARGIPCYAGFNRIQIVQEGKLYFCVNQDTQVSTFGDMSRDNLGALWFSREARAYRKSIKKCVSPCLQWCAYRDEFIELSDVWEKEFIFR